MRSRTIRLLALAWLAAMPAFGGGALAAAAPADLALTLRLEGASASADLTAGTPYHVVAFVENLGGTDAPAFEVDLWANDSHGSLMARHTLEVNGLLAGANITLVDNATLEAAVAGAVVVSGIADPAERVADNSRANNAAQRTLLMAPPPAVLFVEQAGSRLSGTRALPAYSLLALRVVIAEGDSIIFKADADPGALVDCYLFNEANFTAYASAREAPDSNVSITFFGDYTHVATDHFAFTTEPLPPGIYYVVVDNDERLQRGASPTGAVNVTFAVALVNNSLPPAAIAVILGAAAAAVWATVRWRPVFDVRSPLLEVPPPELADDAQDDEAEGAAPSVDDMTEGEGPPPHPP